MRNPNDTHTLELPGFKSPVVTKRKGRPRIHANAAARQAAYVARNGMVTMTVQLPAEVHAQFMEFLKFKDKKKSAVVTHLIRSQLLRKR